MLITIMGQSIRISEDDVRAMGRAASGVIGIKLDKGDKVIGMEVFSKDTKDNNLITVTQRGYGKKTSVDEYKTQNRGGLGILTYKVTEKTGQLVSARIQSHSVKFDLLIASTSGKIIRLAEKQIPKLSRATQGVRLIKLKEDDKVSSLARISASLIENKEV